MRWLLKIRDIRCPGPSDLEAAKVCRRSASQTSSQRSASQTTSVLCRRHPAFRVADIQRSWSQTSRVPRCRHPAFCVADIQHSAAQTSSIPRRRHPAFRVADIQPAFRVADIDLLPGGPRPGVKMAFKGIPKPLGVKMKFCIFGYNKNVAI